MVTAQLSPGNPLRALWPIIIGLLFFFFPGGELEGGSSISKSKIPFVKKSGPIVPDDKSSILPNWKKLETTYTTIYYKDIKDLKRFNRKVDFSPFRSSIKSLFVNNSGGDYLKSARNKTDGIFLRVQEILDMRKRLPKVTIKLFGNIEDFNRTLRRQGRAKDNIRAWYQFETKTVHLNPRDLNEGILAHEIAHHIIDHYLTVRPPRASAEILARYVDEHLFH
jgi:hypothetical protein